MEIGYVKSIKGPIVYLDGLPTAKIGDLIQSEAGALGYVSGLYPTKVEALLVRTDDVRPGQSFTPTGNVLSVPAGDFLLGRAISPLGDPVDGLGPIPKNKDNLRPLESKAPGVIFRSFIREQFETGVSLVDTIIPLGKGQRELVLGDARSGKSGFLLDIVINQKDKDVVCIYCCIGKPLTDVHDLMETLTRNKAMSKTIFIVSFSAETSPLIYLTPKTAFAVAEYFQRKGKDVLLVLDDMGNHAKVYREISLLANRTPGREGYPGDIFYEHATLLERAGKFSKEAGGGSITALPVIELGFTDFTGFISTNLMSMTDGHFLFSGELHSQGRRPAIDLSLSVSRVGQQTQSRVQMELAYKIKQLLAEADRLSSLSSFSAELPADTRLLLSRKSMILETLRQDQSVNVPISRQIILLSLPFCVCLQDKDEKYLVAFKNIITSAFETDPRLSAFANKTLSFSGFEEFINELNVMCPIFMGAIRSPVRPGGVVTVADILGKDLPEANKRILEGKT